MIWDRITAPAEALDGIPLPEGGFRLKPYDDGFGNPTIGAGSLHMPDGSRVTMRSRAITLAEARALLATGLAPCLRKLADGVTQPLTTGQAAGLTSWLYNCGAGQLAGSMIQKMIAAGRPDMAIRQLPGWCEARDARTHVLAPVFGLMHRRQFDVLLCLGVLPADAYRQAWQLTELQGLAAFHQAFADAAAWGKGAPIARGVAQAATNTAPAAVAPTARRLPPSDPDVGSTEALNAASAAGTLTLTEGATP